MTLILNGTSGITDVDGSASAPALTGTDTDTGVFFPAANTIGLSTGGTERARIDSSGNLGLGVTPSAISLGKSFSINDAGTSIWGEGNYAIHTLQNAYYNSGYKYANSSVRAARFSTEAGAFSWSIAGTGTAGNAITFTQAMTLDNSGNLGIGTTSPSASDWNASAQVLQVNKNDTNGGLFKATSSNTNFIFSAGNNLAYIATTTNTPITFSTNGSERARIDSSGNLLVGTTSGIYKLNVTQGGQDFIANFVNSSSSNPFGVLFQYTAASPNNTVRQFIYCADNAGLRMEVRSNGGIANYQGNNVNLSDRREKTNFAPAGDYLAKICAIPVQTFNYIDQNLEEDDGLTLGVVAQDVQSVAPELVMESNWAEKGEEPKMRLSIYQTDLQYALMKSIQELKAIVDAQAVEIAALKGQA